ncbi:MAG: hypothetical protein QOF25_1296 [Mycobacterium sp.]|jgi:L-aminopeptidase/D-esterase-like protein|nr:hypothetical protein [Mycobacterium sp.]
MTPPSGRGRARELGFPVGVMRTGPLNAITDDDGVRVGHATVWHDDCAPTASAIKSSAAVR